MANYHVSEDGVARPCKAQKGQCPLKGEDGENLPHGEFANQAEAYRFAEKVNEEKYGASIGGVSKPNNKMPAGQYGIVPVDELPEELQDAIYASGTEEMKSQAFKLSDGTVINILRADDSTNGGYYGDVVIPLKKIAEVAPDAHTSFKLSLSEGQTLSSWDNDGDFGIYIDDKKYSFAQGDTFPKYNHALPAGFEMPWDEKLYKDAEYATLDAALAQVEAYKNEGKFVVLVQEHEEIREELEEPYEEDFDDEEDYEEALEDYEYALDNIEDTVPEKIQISWTAKAYKNRGEYEQAMANNPEFNGSANNILTFEKAEEYDGYEAELDVDTLNNWRAYRGFSHVVHDPEAK